MPMPRNNPGDIIRSTEWNELADQIDTNTTDIADIQPKLTAPIFPYLKTTAGAVSPAIQAAWNSNLIAVGDVIQTASYHEGYAAGGCNYYVVAPSTGTQDNGRYINFTGFQLKAVPTLLTVDQFGAIPDGATDCRSAFIAAHSDGTQWMMEQPGVYNISSGGLSITKNNFVVAGRGNATVIQFNTSTSGLFIGTTASATATIQNLSMRDLCIRFNSSVAKTLVLFDGVIRSHFENIEFHGRADGNRTGALATCLEISYSFLLTFTNCYWRYGALGLDIKPSATRTPTQFTSLNATYFNGGEIQDNKQGVRIQNSYQVKFEMTIEGHDIRGFESAGNNLSLTLADCYFELNSLDPGVTRDTTHVDIWLGSPQSPVRAADRIVTVRGCLFVGGAGSVDQDHCITVTKSIAVIEKNVVGLTGLTTFVHNAESGTIIRLRENIHINSPFIATVAPKSVYVTDTPTLVDPVGSATNVTVDRTWDANAADGASDLTALKTVVAELADVVATLARDLGQAP